MIRAIVRFSARNRVPVLLATALAVAYGLHSLRTIPVVVQPATSRRTRSS